MSKALHSEKYTLSVVALLTTYNTRWSTIDQEIIDRWHVSMSQSRDPAFSFTYDDARNVGRIDLDAFDVLSDFLALESPDEALNFFRRVGPFQITAHTDPPQASSPAWSSIRKAQSDFKSALSSPTLPPHLYEFIFQPVGLEMRFRPVTPESRFRLDDAAIANCHDVVTALRTCVFLSRKSGFKWRRCARKDCPNLFETSRSNKVFCSPECAHRQAANDYNARKKRRK